MAEYQTVKITSMVLDQNTGKLLGYKDDAGNFYPAPEEDGKQPSPEQAVSAMQAQQQAQVPSAASADVTRMHVMQAQPAQGVPAMATAAPQAMQRRSLKFPEKPAVAAKPAVTQYTHQTYSAAAPPAPQQMLPPQYAPAPTHYVEPQPSNFSYVPPVVQQSQLPPQYQPQLQQGSYVPPPMAAPIQAHAMQPYQAPMAQAQYMQPPLQQGSYVPPPMDMGMQMHAPMAMPAPPMPVQAVPAQMGHHVQMAGQFMPAMAPPAMPEGFHFMPGVGGAVQAMQAMPAYQPEGYQAPQMGLPHDFPGHEALGQHEPPNPFLMGGGAMPGMHGGPMPGMMPHGMGAMMPHQVMGAHPQMGAAPGFAGFGGLSGAQSMGPGFGGMPMQHGMPMQQGMPMAGPAYGAGGYGGGYGGMPPGAMPHGAMPPVGGGGA